MAPPHGGDFSEGDDQPDPVARLIAYGYYDGPTDGVLETLSGRCYRFDLIDEWPGATSDSVRMYLLSPLPDGTFDRLVALISPHCAPRLPTWVPSWWHLDATTKQALDAEVDAASTPTAPPLWAVAGWLRCDLRLRVRRAVPLRDSTEEWVALFGWA